MPPLLTAGTASARVHAVLVRTLVALAIAAAFAATAGPARSAEGSTWRWPIEVPFRVLHEFASPAGPYAAGHRGIDLAAAPASPVHAAAAGTVVFAGRVAGRPVVVLAHGSARTDDELRSTYEPVRSRVGVGLVVRGGDVIGVLGAWPEHCEGRPCLHWGVRRGTRYLDPRSLIEGRVRLLPLGNPVDRSDVLRHAPADTTRPPDAAVVASPNQHSRAMPRSKAGRLTTTAAITLVGGLSLLAAVTNTRRPRWLRRPRGSSP